MRADEGKILGIIGGMGPMATNIFYKMLIDRTPAHKDQDHINMIILSHATMPDRTEAINAGDLSLLLQKLKEDALFLSQSGVSCIAIPCNTSHVVMDEVQRTVSVPIVNMVRETIVALIDDYGCKDQKVGIMATDGTVKAEIFQKEMKKYGLVPVIPDAKSQKTLMKIIYEGVKAGMPVDPKDFMAVEDNLRKAGCKKIILACTELSCYAEENPVSDIFVDAMGILARKVIALCKG